MTASRLPEITLTCRNGHPFATRARGGATVRCKTCRAPKHVPADRPTTARAAAAASAAGDQDQGQDEARGMAARWQAETAWNGKPWPVSGRPGDVCPECAGPLMWEPGRTRTFCPGCKRVDLPAAVAAHYDRQAQQGAVVAVRSAPDKAAERAARARLRALKEQARERVANWLDTIADEDSYDRSQWQRQARELAAMLRGYLPEITDAADEAELTEVWRAVDALVTSTEGAALLHEYEQAQYRAERQYEAQQRTIEYERQQRETAERQAREERERIAAEREAARRAREIEQAQSRKAITSGPTTRPGQGNSSVVAMGQLALMIQASRERKERQIAAKGECSFKHTFGPAPAERLFGVPFRNAYGQITGSAIGGTPQYRACSKHYAAAERQLNREGYSDVCYWEL